MTSLGKKLNDPMCLENSFENLCRVPQAFNEEKIQGRIGGHVVSECKDDEFEGISIANFGYFGDFTCLLAMNLLGKKQSL